MTKVVNLYKEKYDVYCGRPGKGQNGDFGNPYNDNDRETNIAKFKEYFYERLNKDQIFKNKVLQLKGKILGCFCKPKSCHCDIIADYLNNLDTKKLIYAVIGSRNFCNYHFLKETLKWFDIKKIISGGAKGADSLAERYAKENNIPTEILKPEWDRLGKSAAFIRNEQIVRKSDEVIAFWNKISRGTKNAIDKAEELGKPVHIFWKEQDYNYDEIAEL